jgi:uncharacterized membrane protein YkoI
MSTVRTKLATGAAIVAAAAGGGAIANAATSGTASSSGANAPSASQPQGGGPAAGRHQANGRTEQALSGTVAAKVRAAALQKVPGTVERVETNVDSSSPYEAHITKSDGTQVEVQVSKDYTVAAVNTMGGMHP